MARKLTSLFAAAAACLVASAALAATASAGPVWKFNEVTLAGSETVLNHDVTSDFTIPGLTTSCKPFVYRMTVSNVAGTGVASITEVPLSNCFTDSKVCEVEAITANGLPWSATLKALGGSNYLVISGVNFSIAYAGELCALGGSEVVAKGSAGGLVSNATESTKFDASTFSATGTSLGSLVEWNGLFTMIATGSHVGESLTVG